MACALCLWRQILGHLSQMWALAEADLLNEHAGGKDGTQQPITSLEVRRPPGRPPAGPGPSKSRIPQTNPLLPFFFPNYFFS